MTMEVGAMAGKNLIDAPNGFIESEILPDGHKVHYVIGYFSPFGWCIQTKVTESIDAYMAAMRYLTESWHMVATSGGIECLPTWWRFV